MPLDNYKIELNLNINLTFYTKSVLLIKALQYYIQYILNTTIAFYNEKDHVSTSILVPYSVALTPPQN